MGRKRYYGKAKSLRWNMPHAWGGTCSSFNIVRILERVFFEFWFCLLLFNFVCLFWFCFILNLFIYFISQWSIQIVERKMFMSPGFCISLTFLCCRNSFPFYIFTIALLLHYCLIFRLPTFRK